MLTDKLSWVTWALWTDWVLKLITPKPTFKEYGRLINQKALTTTATPYTPKLDKKSFFLWTGIGRLVKSFFSEPSTSFILKISHQSSRSMMENLKSLNWKTKDSTSWSYYLLTATSILWFWRTLNGMITLPRARKSTTKMRELFTKFRVIFSRE